MKPEEAYIEIYDDFYMTHYVPLKPTGKWKLKSGPLYRDRIFIQHQGRLFKRWVSENCIKFLPKEEETIFNCKGGGGS